MLDFPTLIDLDLSKVNWINFATKQKAALQEITVATPTPLDDIGLDYGVDIIIEKLKAKQATPIMMAGPMLDQAAVIALAEKYGLTISPLIVSWLVSMAPVIVEILLKRWAARK